MPKYTVRIDACFTYEIEADSEDEAAAAAETQFENGEYEDNRVTEVLVFGDDEGEDDDDD